MDNETLKARGTFLLGLGVLLLGVAGIVWSCAKIAETLYIRQVMASSSYVPFQHSSVGSELPKVSDGETKSTEQTRKENVQDVVQFLRLSETNTKTQPTTGN